MSSETLGRAERRRTMLLGCATLMVMTLVGALVQKTSGANAVTAAWIYGGGTLLMAWITARTTAYPRWAWFAAAGVLVGTLVIAAVRLPAPAQVKAWTSTAWMLPWLFLVTASSPAPATGPCSPQRAWSGPLLVGTSAVFSLILLGVWLM